MATAKFHSFRGESSALVLVARNVFEFPVAVYVPKTAIKADAKKGDMIEIPEGYKVVPFGDRVANNGASLLTLSF